MVSNTLLSIGSIIAFFVILVKSGDILEYMMGDNPDETSLIENKDLLTDTIEKKKETEKKPIKIS